MSHSCLRFRKAAASAAFVLLLCNITLPRSAFCGPQNENGGVPLPFAEFVHDSLKPSSSGTVYPFSSGPMRQPIQQLSYIEAAPEVPPTQTVTVPAEHGAYHSAPVTYSVPEPNQYFETPVYQPIYRQQKDLPQRWLSAEALLWWTSEVDLPVLLTGGAPGTPGAIAGVLGQPTTNVLEGGGDIFGFAQGGVRLRGGKWFDKNDGSGLMAEFLMLGSRGENSISTSTGEPILARPFFNAGPGNNLQDSQLIAFPGLSHGAFRMNAETRMYSAGLHYWEELYDSCCCCCNTCNTGCGESYNDGCGEGCDGRGNNGSSGGSFFQSNNRRGNSKTSFGVFLGPRFAHLDDTLLVRESLNSVASGSRFELQDLFQTENSFLGGEVGFLARRRQGRLHFDLGLQVALGATRQELDIHGRNTVTTAGGISSTTAGGFLAHTSNIGTYDRTQFSVIPALDLKLGYQARSGWRFSVGYSLMFWTNVLRAAEQIDTTINEDFFARPNLPSTGANRPQPLFRESDYLAHGLTFGIEKSW